MKLSPLPCWEDLAPEIRWKRIAEIAEEITAEAQARREEKGIPPMGADAIRRQDPHATPLKTKRSYAPLFHAAIKRSGLRWWKPTARSPAPSAKLLRR